jgi:hypothetical protein
MVAAPCMYHGFLEERLQQLLHTIRCEAAFVKLHRNPAALRFLACSGANGSKIPAVRLTRLFRAVQPDLCTAWSELLRTLLVWTGRIGHLGMLRNHHRSQARCSCSTLRHHLWPNTTLVVVGRIIMWFDCILT